MSVTTTVWESTSPLFYVRNANVDHATIFGRLKRLDPEWAHHDERGRRVQFLAVRSHQNERAGALLRFRVAPPKGVDALEKQVIFDVGSTFSGALVLCANKQNHDGSSRIPIPEDDLMDFVRRKITSAGFDVEGLIIRPMSAAYVGRKKSHFSIPSVSIRGDFIVRDPLIARDSYELGIGRMRTFGYGMLRLSLPQGN